MGLVFQARDRLADHTVAVKFMRTVNARLAERFMREARLLASVDHPGVVRYVAHGQTPDGELYLAMEWLEGETLEARLDRKGLTIDETLILGAKVAEALAAAHARGIVHRDIKPAN